MSELPAAADPPRYYRLELPARYGWLNLNQRAGHWGRRHEGTRIWRAMACRAAQRAQVPPLGRGHVVAELRFADRRRRDPHNWMATAKAAIDGLVDAKVFPDDRAEIVVGPDMRLGPVALRGGEQMVLHIWPLPAAGRAAHPPGVRVAWEHDPLGFVDRISQPEEEAQP